MTPQEYQQAIQSVISDIEGGAVTNLMVQLATDTLAVIRYRVRQTGIDSKGVKYKDYTDQYLRFKSGLTRRRVYNEDDTIKKNKKTGAPLKGRAYPNKYKGFTDFDYSGDMWNSMQVTRVNDDTAAIVFTGEDAGGVSNRDKLQWNTNRFGEINQVSAEEKKQIIADYKTGVLDIFARHGLMPKG